jgi:hypothetical protein
METTKKQKKSRHLFTRCEVYPGLFDNEFYVEVGRSSILINRDRVKVDEAPDESGVEGKVLSYPVRRDNGSLLIEITGEESIREWVPEDITSFE